MKLRSSNRRQFRSSATSLCWEKFEISQFLIRKLMQEIMWASWWVEAIEMIWRTDLMGEVKNWKSSQPWLESLKVLWSVIEIIWSHLHFHYYSRLSSNLIDIAHKWAALYNRTVVWTFETSKMSSGDCEKMEIWNIHRLKIEIMWLMKFIESVTISGSRYSFENKHIRVAGPRTTIRNDRELGNT